MNILVLIDSCTIILIILLMTHVTTHVATYGYEEV